MNLAELQNHQKKLYDSIIIRRNSDRYVSRYIFRGETSKITSVKSELMSMESLSISYGKLVEVLNYPDLAIFNDDLYKINLSDIADDKEETKKYAPCLRKNSIDISCLLSEKANIVIDIAKMFKEFSANQLSGIYDHSLEVDKFQILSDKYNVCIIKKYLDIKIMLYYLKCVFRRS